MNLYVAELSEITLALRRDNEQIQLLTDQLSKFFKAIFGDRIWIRYYYTFPFISRFFYYFSTNFFNLQTVGEEYIQLIQVSNQKNPKAVTFLQRLIFLLIEVFGEIFTVICFKKLHSILKKIDRNQNSAFITFILTFLEVENFVKLYKSIFYTFKFKYATYSRMFSNISYLSLRLQTNLQISKMFTFIGISIFLQSIVLFSLKVLYQIKKNQVYSKLKTTSNNKEVDKTNYICGICLIPKFPVCAPCGHTFCWDCIIEYSLAEEMRVNFGRCPNCRIEFMLNRIVPLLNY